MTFTLITHFKGYKVQVKIVNSLNVLNNKASIKIRISIRFGAITGTLS
jgi:hypothetical protein